MNGAPQPGGKYPLVAERKRCSSIVRLGRVQALRRRRFGILHGLDGRACARQRGVGGRTEGGVRARLERATPRRHADPALVFPALAPPATETVADLPFARFTGPGAPT